MSTYKVTLTLTKPEVCSRSCSSVACGQMCWTNIAVETSRGGSTGGRKAGRVIP